MRFSYVDHVFVGAHTAASPSDDEWGRHCVEIERERNTTRGVLVYTQGGGPSTKQRQLMRAALHEVPAPPTAIMTDSAMVRGIITSLNWFLGNQVHAFGPADLDHALRYISRDGAKLDIDTIVAALVALTSELSIALPMNRQRQR